LLASRACIFFSFFYENKDNHPKLNFVAVEETSYLMSCIGFSLLCQWYETYDILKDATG
jgi:hypothetical protein